jgi:DNA polymerase
VTDAPAVAFVDFETRSRADLKAIGGRRYAEHPSTEVVCAVIRSTHGVTDVWTPGSALPPEFLRFDALAAHNGINFDRHIWRKLGWPEPRRWVDTAELARVAGFPLVSLEYLGSHLIGVEKDLEGNALTKQLSAPDLYYGPALETVLATRKAQWKAANKGRLPAAQIKAALVADLDRACAAPGPVPADVLARVVRYCRLDVEIMAKLWEFVLWEWDGADLPGLELADRALNDRGIRFDRELAQILIDASEELGRVACEAAGITPDVVRSTKKLTAELARLGVTVLDCTADTLQAAKAGASPAAVALIEARQATASIAVGKLEAGLARCSPDGRLRDNRKYMGAHTGRWAGVGMQLDNLAKGL